MTTSLLPNNNKISLKLMKGEKIIENNLLGYYLNKPNMSVEVLEPGLVLIRHFLSESEQKRIARNAIKWGLNDDRGFFDKDKITGERKLNADTSRGRIYDAITNFPKWLSDFASKACDISQKADPSMPAMKCTHLLLNMYTSSTGLVWHRDIYENDGKSHNPVVNLCVGASCRFGIRHEDEPGVEGDTERELILRSGDVILFGGKCRFIKHSVLEVMMKECPNWMDNPCRFSFTFRDSPEIIGREDEFRYFKINKHLIGQENFKVPTNPYEFKGIPVQTSQMKL